MARREVKKNNNLFYIAVGAIVLIIIILLVVIFTSGNDEIIPPEDNPTNNNTEQNGTNDNELPPANPDENEGDTSDEDEDTGKHTLYNDIKFEIVDDSVQTSINLNIRKEPSSSGKILYNAKKGTTFNRIGIGENGWDMLKLDDGSTAFASSQYLTGSGTRDGESGAGYPVAETSGRTTSNTPIDTTHYTKNTLKDGITQSEADTFFKNAVFFGDSVTLGFQNYVDKQDSNFLGGLVVYGMGSYGLGHSLRAVSADSLHPIYKGYQTQLWNLAKDLKAEKVFLMFGLNDLGLYGVKDSLTNYKTLINAIKEHNPNTQIYVLSTTPVTSSYNGKYLNNSNIRQFNNSIRENADSWGITFIDVASYLMDNNGNLKLTFASDGQFHLTESAYKEWIKVLRSFASYNLEEGV